MHPAFYSRTYWKDKMSPRRDPLTSRTLFAILVFIGCLTVAACAQETADPPRMMAADAHPSFEVATIKPADPDYRGKTIGKRGRNFRTRNTSLTELIGYAYNLHKNQITGAPSWAENDKYDLSAVPDQDGVPSDLQWKAMLQQLIADRFKLTIHHEQKELSVYVLSVDKDGPRNLTKSDSTAPDFNLSIDAAPEGMALTLQRGSMTNLAVFGLQGAVLDRPVLDQTGIAGRFDLVLKWLPDESQFGGRMKIPETDKSAPGLFTAIREQLGLRLDALKAPADVIVIDHVEKPSGN